GRRAHLVGPGSVPGVRVAPRPAAAQECCMNPRFFEVPVMLAQVQLFPEQASTTASQVDSLFLFLLAVTSFVAVMVAVLIFYFAIRYRRRVEGARPPRILGSLRLE